MATMEQDQQPSRRPEDSAFKQQRLPAWQPILTPMRVVGIFLVIGIIFLPVGGVLLGSSNAITQKTIRYDGDSVDVEGCKISSDWQGVNCTITFNIDKKMTGPVWVYYELTNYYQNHRRYVKSRDPDQLLGEQRSSVELIDCDPLKKSGGELLNPCGLIANSLFNDKISLGNESALEFELDEKDISWKSDRENKFKQVQGFKKKQEDDDTLTCQDVFGDNSKYDDCGKTYKDGKLYYFWYPENDKYRYLYESYPGIVSPLDGVKDEHFIVWMRTAGLPRFRKPFGRIRDDLPKGTQLSFDITANFNVKEFDGSKSIVITEIGTYGGKNPFLGIAYLVVGCISIALAIAFAAKNQFAPRALGDVRSLGWAGQH